MNRLRLVPLLAVAAAALLTLKVIGLVTEGRFALSGSGAAAARDAAESEVWDNVARRHQGAAAGADPAGAPADGGHGEADPAGHGGAFPATEGSEAAAPAVDDHGEAEPADAGHGEAAAEPGHEEAAAHEEVAADGHGDPAGQEAGGHGEEAGGNGEAAGESGGGHGESGGGGGISIANQPQPDTPPVDVTPMQAVSETERELLESLAERRRQLEARSGELDEREALLQATESRIEQRIADLKALEAQIQAAADAQEAARSEEMLTVVAMYETMKAKDAARIFEGMDLAVLVDIATKIKPKKLAEILASMSPASAQQLTVELATRGERPALPAVSQLPKIGTDIGQSQ